MRKTFRLLFFVILIAIVFYGLWFAISYLFNFISGLGKEVAAAAITALIGLFGILYAQWQSKAKEIADSHRPAKIEVYGIFVDIVERFMDAERHEDENLDPESDDFPEDLRDQFTRLSRGMIIWASPNVLKKWSLFREKTGSAKTAKDTLLAVDGVLQAIRDDLGNSNFGLAKGDVVKIYLKNPDEING